MSDIIAAAAASISVHGINWIPAVNSVKELPKFPEEGTACMLENYSIAVVFQALGWLILAGEPNMYFDPLILADLQIENTRYNTEMARILYI